MQVSTHITMSAKKVDSDHYTNEYSRIRKLTSTYDIRTQSVRHLCLLFYIVQFMSICIFQNEFGLTEEQAAGKF